MYEIDFNGSLRFIAFYCFYLSYNCLLIKTSVHECSYLFDRLLSKRKQVGLYTRHLRRELIPAIEKLYPEDDFIFVQDGASSHTSGMCQDFLREKDWTEVALFRRISGHRFPRTWIHWIIIFGIGWRAQCIQNERGKEASAMLTNWSRAVVKTGKRQLMWMSSTEL
jgi:hypothetical protein